MSIYFIHLIDLLGHLHYCHPVPPHHLDCVPWSRVWQEYMKAHYAYCRG